MARRDGLAGRLLVIISLLACTVPSAVQAAGKPFAVAVVVHVDGQVCGGVVKATTVRGALDELGVSRGPLDRVTPSLSAQLPRDRTIRVTRVDRRQVTERQPVPFGRDFEYTASLRAGLRKAVVPGVEGRKELTFDVWYKDGVETSRKLVGERVTVPPQNERILVGARQSSVSRGLTGSRRVLIMEATGYTPGPESCGKFADGWTACGLRAQHGVVAVDPRYIPFGTRLYIKGYGYAIAGDTGSAIKGLRIDLCHESYQKAMAVGRRRVEVTILD